MADKERNVVLNFKMDGQVQYAQTLREINAVMNTAAKEYKNHIAAMGQDASATDKLRAEKKKLEIQMEAAQKRTQMLRTQYEAMAKDTNTTTGQLAQMYGKLLDAERAETSLQKSLERVNGGLSEQAIEARDAKEILNKLQNESKTLDAEQKKLTSSFKLQNAELGENASEAEKTELAQKQLSSQMNLTERTVKNLEKQLDATKKIYGENSREVMQMESKLNEAKLTVNEFKKSLNGIDSSSESLNNLGKKMDLNNLLEATELLQGLSEKLIDVGKSAIEFGLSFGDSQTNLQANLGLTAEEAEKLNVVVENVFKNGVVGSIEEASQAVHIVKQSFGDLDNTSLEKLTNNITTIAKRTGTDVQENVNAAKQMMTAFGISGEEATDLIATGFQNGLNRSGDFLDTLNEYSPHFKAAGFSANEMLQIINNGMQNGAMNTDKAADAVKEFQIRLGDGSFEKIVGNYSTETQNMFKKWQDGKATVADVAQSISTDLNKMTPKEQQVALSELSTQFEDLGIDGAAALFSVGKEFDNVNGKADQMSQKSPGEKWTASLRELQTTARPIGTMIVETMTPVIDTLGKVFEWFTKLPEPIQNFTLIFVGLSVAFVILTPIVAALAASFGALNISLLPIIGIIAAVALAITGIILIIQNWGTITDWLSEKWTQFKDWFTGLWQEIVQVCSDAWLAVSTYFSSEWAAFLELYHSIFDPLAQFFSDLWSGIVETASRFWSNLVATASNLWSQLTQAWSNTWSTILAILDPILSFLKTMLAAAWLSIQAAAQIAWALISKYIIDPITQAYNWVKGKIEDLANWLSGKWEWIKSITLSAWNLVKQYIIDPIVQTYNKVKEKLGDLANWILQKWNSIKSATSAAWNLVKQYIIDPITSAYTSVVEKVSSMYTSVVAKFNAIKSAASEKFNAAKDAIVNPIKEAVDAVKKWIDKIEGFFKNLKLKIPKPELPPLPHFSLETSTKTVMGKEITFPTGFDVSWRAKGAIFTQPTIFGMSGGRLQGAGEAGPEAVLPLNEKTLGAIGEGIAKTMKGSGTNVNIYSRDDAESIARATERALRRLAYQL